MLFLPPPPTSQNIDRSERGLFLLGLVGFAIQSNRVGQASCSFWSNYGWNKDTVCSLGCCSSLLQPTPELHMEMFVSLRVCRPNWCKILRHWHITEGQSTDLQLICPTSCVFGCSAAGGEIFNQCVSDQEDEAFSEEDVKRLMRQILEGVAFLHLNNVVHLDLKVCGHSWLSTISFTLCHLCSWYVSNLVN